MIEKNLLKKEGLAFGRTLQRAYKLESPELYPIKGGDL